MSRASALLGAAAGFAVRRRRVIVPTALIAGLAMAVAAFALLTPTADTDSLIPKAAEASRASSAIEAKFGGEPIVVMAEEDLRKLLLTSDMARLLKLEGCLGGRVPKGATPYGGRTSPCARIAASGLVRRVYGPATFLSELAGQVTGTLSAEVRAAAGRVRTAGNAARAKALKDGLSESAAAAAAQAASLQEQRRSAAALARLQLQTGITGWPGIDNPDFVSAIVFDGSRGRGEPRTSLSYLFPSSGAAVIQVRPRSGLTKAQTERLTRDVSAAARMPDFQLRNGGNYIVTGSSVLAESIAGEVATGVTPLLALAAALMALALGLAFPVRSRLLPLVLALLAAAFVYGGMALMGLSFTVAAVGGVPVLIGLAVDYAVQLHARTIEAEADGADPPDSIISGARNGGPAIATAAAATAAGFLALLLSPAPMVRGFGLVLVAGVAVALIAALMVGSGLLSARSPSGVARWSAAAADWADSAVDGVRQIATPLRPVRWLGRSVRAGGAALARRPMAVMGVAVVLAGVGWAMEGSLTVDSDVSRLVPSGTPALRDLSAFQRQAGVAGEVDLMLAGDRALDPATLDWLRGFREQALSRWGWSQDRGCAGGAKLCPGASLTDFVRAGGTAEQTGAAIESIPEYLRSATVSADGKALLTGFGIRLIPEPEQQKVFDDLRRRAAGAPSGVTAYLGGLPVVAAAANERVSDPDSRRLITLVALLASGLALALAFRSWRRIVIPLAATLLATGWATLALWVLGIELNPLSASLGALVIAIGTEFAVLLSERQRSEHELGADLERSLSLAFRTTGRAVAVSGATVVVGFAVLTVSDIRILREFGLATVVDLIVALVAVMVIVPAMIRLLAARAGSRSVGSA